MNYIPIEGGDVLGKGAYGCVVTPAPECSGAPEDPDMVAKLLFNESKIGEEIAGYIRMAQVDPFHTFSLSTKSPFPCISSLGRVSPADRVQCGILRPADEPMKALLFGKLKGTTFSKVLWSNPNPKDFIVLIMRILLALSIMEGRVSHFDLHSDNIYVTSPPHMSPPAAESDAIPTVTSLSTASSAPTSDSTVSSVSSFDPDSTVSSSSSSDSSKSEAGGTASFDFPELQISREIAAAPAIAQAQAIALFASRESEAPPRISPLSRLPSPSFDARLGILEHDEGPFLRVSDALSPIGSPGKLDFFTGSPILGGVRTRSGAGGPRETPVPEDEIKAALDVLRKFPTSIAISLSRDVLWSRLQVFLRDRRITKAIVVRRAIDVYLENLKQTYFRRSSDPPLSEWRPIIIDYGMLQTIEDHVRSIPTDTSFHPYHFYFSHDFLLATIWQRNPGATFDDLLRQFLARIDFTTKTFNIGGRPSERQSPAPWIIASSIRSIFNLRRDPKARQIYRMFNASLEAEFMRLLFSYYRDTIYSTLGYSDPAKTIHDFWELIVTKHDLFVFMFYLASEWNYGKHVPAPAPEIYEICEEIAYLARMVVSYDVFKRPFAFQVYNFLVPMLERAGFEMDTLTVASTPHEEFKYIRGTLSPEETVAYARDLPKTKFSDNPMVMHNIKTADESVIGKRSTDPYTTNADSDMLYAWYTRTFGRP